MSVAHRGRAVGGLLDNVGRPVSPARHKVIGFDNWTGGAHLFERLVDAFRSDGFDLSLVHLGSWGNDKGRPSSERVGSLEVRDIAHFETGGLEGVLEAERPAAVLFMSTDTFAHRAFNRYCRKRRIPTVHLYHGVVSVQAVGEGGQYKGNVLAQLRFVGSKVGKALRHVWPAYVRSLWLTGAERSEWRRFAVDIMRGALGRFAATSAVDARTDICCVYVEADVDHAVRKYGFKRDDVFVVGNPDMIQFGLDAGLVGSRLNTLARNRRSVMYIDTGLIFTGWVFSSAEDFVGHIIGTRDHLAADGRSLIFKPHPQHYMAGEALRALERQGVEVCPNAEFISRLEECCACIVETSSAALIPALLGMPLLLANYGKLTEQRFGRVLASYPRARSLRDLAEFASVLDSEERECNIGACLRWISANSGPLPADLMPARVARVVADLVRRDATHATDC